MERFKATLAVVGKDEQISLSFKSTIVAKFFPEAEIFAGKKLKRILEEALGKYHARLRKRRGEELADREIKRLMEIFGKNYCNIKENEEYAVLSREEILCCCEWSRHY